MKKNSSSNNKNNKKHEEVSVPQDKKEQIPTLRRIIDELNDITRQMSSTHKLTEQEYQDALKQEEKEKAEATLWGKFKKLVEKLEEEWHRDFALHNMEHIEQLKKQAAEELDEKERKKIIKRRKPIRDRIKKLYKGEKILDREEIATQELAEIEKSDPILNIVERILLNLSTDPRSEDVLSIQKAKSEGKIPQDSTPFSYPKITSDVKQPHYYISNYGVMVLYKTLDETGIRDTLPEAGNFLETEEMIIASQLEKYIDINYNPNSYRVEVELESLKTLEEGTLALASKRIKRNYKRNFTSNIIPFRQWFKK